MLGTIGGLAVLVSLVIFANVIIRFYKHLQKAEGMVVKTTLKRVAIALGLFIGGSIMLNTVDDGIEVASDEIDAKEETKEEKEVDVTSEKDIEKLVNELIGGTSNTGEKRVEKVVYNEVDTSPYIGLNLHADENITVKLARSGMLKDTLEIMKALNKEGYKGKFYVDWRLPLTDKYGNTEPGKVMSINISAEDFGKINYDGFDYLNLPNIAESYFEHPGFSN